MAPIEPAIGTKKQVGKFMKVFNPSNLHEYQIIRYFFCSLLVTATDYIVFFTLSQILSIVFSNIISYSIAICLSFHLHKKFVFKLEKNAYKTFSLIIIFSLLAVLISTAAVVLFNRLFGNIFLAKIITTGTMFFYNFFSKKFAFGGRGL